MRYPFRALLTAPRPRVLALSAPALLGFIALLTGCSDDPVKPTTTTEADTTYLKPENNFKTVKNNLHIGELETAPQANLKINWNTMVNDLQCHHVDNPATLIKKVVLLRVKSSSTDEVTEWLDTDKLNSDSLAAGIGFGDIEPDGTSTSAQLKDFTFNDQSFDYKTNYKEDDSITYLLIWQHGTDAGHDASSMLFLKPTAGETNDKVDAPDNADCGMLDYQANLTDLTPVSISKTAPWKVDWKAIKQDSQGNTLSPLVDRLLIGFYKDKSREDLEADFLNLQLDATESWELRFDLVSHADLSYATNRDGSGQQFNGFERPNGQTGTWIMGLFCTSCTSPAPLIVTILEPN